jgi:hypothetical protein
MINKIESTIILMSLKENSLKFFYLQCRVVLIVNLSSFETKIQSKHSIKAFLFIISIKFRLNFYLS